jgi:hypothetical protein
MDWLVFIVGGVAASPRHASLGRMVGRPVRIGFFAQQPAKTSSRAIQRRSRSVRSAWRVWLTRNQ